MLIYVRICLFLLMLSLTGSAYPDDTLVILSPHQKSIQREFIPRFKRWYQQNFTEKINVQWIDQGGSEHNLRYLKHQFSTHPDSAGIDIFWGGGDMAFRNMDQKHYLIPAQLPSETEKSIPEFLMGSRIISGKKTWYASAMSAFGIFYNRQLLRTLKLPEPVSWQDLGNPRYSDQLSAADPRHSGSSLIIFLTMLYSETWQTGWNNIISMMANVRKFERSGSAPVRAVTTMDAPIAAAIDFYAMSKIREIGKERLAFILPAGKTIFNADPVALLKGAPNLLPGRRFIHFLLTPEAQQLWLLPAGLPGGPEVSTLGRSAVLREAWERAGTSSVTSANPFTMAAPQFHFMTDKVAKVKPVLKDLIGAIYIDQHKLLKQAWKSAIHSRTGETLIRQMTSPPAAEDELLSWSSSWDDPLFRNKLLNQMRQKAEHMFLSVIAASGSTSPDQPAATL